VNVFPLGRSRSQEGLDTLRLVASRSADQLNNLAVRGLHSIVQRMCSDATAWPASLSVSARFGRLLSTRELAAACLLCAMECSTLRPIDSKLIAGRAAGTAAVVATAAFVCVRVRRARILWRIWHREARKSAATASRGTTRCRRDKPSRSRSGGLIRTVRAVKVAAPSTFGDYSGGRWWQPTGPCRGRMQAAAVVAEQKALRRMITKHLVS
jgi:hypothetical protein